MQQPEHKAMFVCGPGTQGSCVMCYTTTLPHECLKFIHMIFSLQSSPFSLLALLQQFQLSMLLTCIQLSLCGQTPSINSSWILKTSKSVLLSYFKRSLSTAQFSLFSMLLFRATSMASIRDCCTESKFRCVSAFFFSMPPSKTWQLSYFELLEQQVI